MTNPIRRLRLAAILVVAAISWHGPAFGESQADVASSTMSAAELQTLLDTLEDDQARAALIGQLRALAAAHESAAPEAPPAARTARFLGAVSDNFRSVNAELIKATQWFTRLPEAFEWVRTELADPAARGRWLEIAGRLAAIFGVGIVVWFGIVRGLRRPMAKLQQRTETSVISRTAFLGTRTLLDVLPLIGFVAGTYAMLLILQPRPETRLVALAAINAHVIAQGLMMAMRLVLAPRSPGLRVTPVSDEGAAYIAIWWQRLVYLSAYGYFVANMFLILGAAPAVHGVVLKFVGLLLLLMLTMVILQSRHGVAATIRGDGDPTALATIRRRFADTWHIAAILYVAAIYLIWALNVENGAWFIMRASLLTVTILVVVRYLRAGLNVLLRHGFSIAADYRLRFPTLEARANRYLSVLRYAVLAFLYVFAGLGLLEGWGLGSFAWLGSELGRAALSAIVDIVFVGLLALLVWEATNVFVERYLGPDETGQLTQSARARTLLPVMRAVIQVTAVVLVGLVVLSEIGIDITPLLAGAGVIGLAVGFGSQKLVQDIITGLFILIEDTILVGDVIEVDGRTGVVEDISIRTLKLRDLWGSLHTIPFSAVTSIKNMTKDFAYYVFDIGVAYREDVDQVMAVLREIDGEMRAEPEWGTDMLEPLDVWGLDRFDDSAVVVRARLKTRANRRWPVGREFNRRIKIAFDRYGIEIPFPHTTVYFGVDKAGHAPAAAVRVGQLSDSTTPQQATEEFQPKPKTTSRKPGELESADLLDGSADGAGGSD